MEIKLYMNDYMDIYVSKDGRVLVEVGQIIEDGKVENGNTYANSSFATFMKYFGINVENNQKEIVKYLVDNDLYLHMQRISKETGIEYSLHDVSTKENLVTYKSFDELVATEVFQQNNSIEN